MEQRAAEAEEPPQFSGFVRLPGPRFMSPRRVCLLILVGAVLLGFLIVLPVQWPWLSFMAGWGPVVPGVVFFLIFAPVAAWLTRSHRRRAAGERVQWKQDPARTKAELAAVDFYETYVAGFWWRVSGETVEKYLSRVARGEGRMIVLGTVDAPLTDDGLLNEEADLVQRSMQKAHWALYIPLGLFLFALGVKIVVFTGVVSNGQLASSHLLSLAIGVGMVVLSLTTVGLLRPFGTVMITSPRRILTFRALWGERVFTTDDSVLLVRGGQGGVTCLFYRRDGRMSWVSFPSTMAPGLSALVSRWCLAERPAEAAAGSGRLQSEGEGADTSSLTT